ncbi:Heparanase-like protein [Actinidia chinensis var. chinensis]|uniref:Heparanase-like protein n=1 Tax=Actinidia chinensis var. chinensis TaxID=1590841 RepID=A0A2R6PCW0_ACTCC|nr:Heparanase-like protein [Actinidia chinensis var. chinensis]
MGFHVSLFLLLACISSIWAQEVEYAVILVNGTQAVAKTDANYICATIDWWPHDKCNYNQCPWGYSSIINLDLSHPFLANTIQAFEHLRIRVGGSLQDAVLYDVGNLKTPCHPFRKMRDGLFGFSKGCLHMKRWDEVNDFFKKTGVLLTFGLNALHGRHQIRRRVWGGDWDSSNANDFITYTISKGHQIDSWEFGNELCGSGIGASVGAEQYGRDLIKLKSMINELYKNFNPKPILVAPGGFYDKQWYDKVLQVSGSLVVNAVTHHIYNLGAGVDRNLVNKILDPSHLSKVSETFSNLKQTIQTHGPWASAWIGESGGAYNSGRRNVSNTFVNSFWYLDQLGMAAKYDTRVYCRQTLIGGNYGLLDRTTFVPNPDYYSALLWHRLMGKEVLAVNTSASPYLRSYAHCSKGRAGITLLLINLSNHTRFDIGVQNSMNVNLHAKETTHHSKKSFTHGLKRNMLWVGTKASDGTSFREEYLLTPEDGNLQSKTMLLNGKPLQLTDDGDIPSLNPVLVDPNSLMTIAPLSIKFVAFPNFEASACK